MTKNGTSGMKMDKESAFAKNERILKAIFCCILLTPIFTGCSISPEPVTDMNWNNREKSDQLTRMYGYMEDDAVYEAADAGVKSASH